VWKDLSGFLVPGSDDPRHEISVGEWNAFLAALEAAGDPEDYAESGANRADRISVTAWNALLAAVGPGCDLTAFRASGADNPARPISKTVWNALLDELEAAYERLPEYQGPICNNLRLPDWMIGNSPGAVDRAWARTSHFTTEAIDGEITIGLAAFVVNLTAGDMVERSSGLGGLDIVSSQQTLLIEYPEGTVHAVAQLGADKTFIVPPGGVTEVTATVNIPSGAQFWVQRSAQNADNSAPVKLPISFYSGAGDFAVHGNALQTAFIADGAIDPDELHATTDSYNAFSCPPAYILGPTTKRTFALVGNSRTEGVQDTLASNTHGDVGQIARALTEQGLAYINMGYGNDSMNEWLASHTERLAIAQLCTDVITGDPTNDFGRLGRTAEQAIADYETFAALFTERAWATTSPPIATTSSDSFATVENQTVNAGYNASRITFNDAVRAGLVGYHGYFELADVLDYARDDGRWKLIDGLPSTADGVHELPRANQEISDSGALAMLLPVVTLGTLSGTFTLAESAAQGTVAGAIVGKTAASGIQLIDDAGGRVALSGTNIVRGATELDYESATSHSFTVREDHADASNQPKDTVLTLSVTDVGLGPEIISGSNSASPSGAADGSTIFHQVIAVQTLTPYRVSFTVSGFTAGGFFLRFADNTVNHQGPIVANGSYSYDMTTGGIITGDITLLASGITTLTVSNISVKRIY
jgi:hypothetical protein